MIGIDRHEHQHYGKRIIRAIEETEQPTIRKLMKKCIELQAKYEAYPVMSRLWCADLDDIEFDNAIEGIKAAGKDLYSFCSASGPFYEKKHPWKGYLTVLSENAKVLDRRSCPKLRAYMTNAPKNLKQVMSFKPEDNPALAAIAIGVSVLIILKPWFWEADGSAFNLDW